MYKSKLQQLCHKQKWALPKYTCIKDGQDHCPLFKAAVVVGGATFDTSAACKNAKQASNEAAKLALLHFTSEPSNQTSENVKMTNYKEEVENSDAHSADMAVKLDIQDQFKKKLKMYAQRKSLDVPVYHTEKAGLCFRGHVSIGENWFPSQELFRTMEEAENAAAQAALLSLSTDAFHENDHSSYKYLLQELMSNEGYTLPTYTTTKSNDPHGQTFSSTVEVEGEVFEGATAKSKKLAELNAAKAAYTVFIERKLFQPSYFSPKPSSDGVPLHHFREGQSGKPAQGAMLKAPAACKSSQQACNEADKHASLQFNSVVADLQDEFKKKLHMYAQRKNLDLPVYSTEKDGLCFSAQVSIGENQFKSQQLFGTIEEAENAAAQTAFLSLAKDAFHENDPIFYRNLLQEQMSNEGYSSSPAYTTTESSHPHGQTFVSTVKVQGKVFQGATAELNAAKAARKLFQPGYFSPRPSNEDVVERSATISDHQKNQTIEMKCYLLCNRVKVFTQFPNTALPEGVVMLPISENRWTMVSLEFPGEKSV